ncbi:kinase-like domain-containing protein [Rhizophagus clarus]|uniref:Kinase-like domain-containing protein n=1 Tax=Rhizophagus clarus TaxID=94130 RepID=A0A8H3KVV1_9GLOM|nr:kinase-like domain-containing protein [Rhizophagus clarus]
MSVIREELIGAAFNRAYALINYKTHNDIHKRHESKKQTILDDESLTKDEKSEAIKELIKIYDNEKVLYNSGTRRVCENCKQECLATLYCEYCVRNYLKDNFSKWKSGNDDIDNLIQECQMKALNPGVIVEWIPYDEFKNIKYLTKGGFSEIYTAEWIAGSYDEWDSREQRLKRFGETGKTQEVILKRLKNVESAKKSWFEEVNSHLTISNKWADTVVQCFGLTQDPSNEDYMLVMNKFDADLRKYLQQNHNHLTWKERIQIATNIIISLKRIHNENAIHRDLHSGNILFDDYKVLNISDLGFCGPVDKPLKGVYGNLPYIAPEVIDGKETTFKSDIYSVAMLMWEISSGQPPFNNYKDDFYLAMKIIEGIRPKIVPGTPEVYRNLMVQCWDANPLNRPDIETLQDEISELNYSYYHKNSNELNQSKENNIINFHDSLESHTNSRLFTSKVYQFEDLPEPRNATAEELEAFHSNKSYNNLNIPNNIEDIGKSSSNQKNDTSQINNSNKSSKGRLEDDKNFQEITIMQQIQIKKYQNIDDDDGICNNPNFHPEEQDEFELPDIDTNELYKTE